MLKSFVVVIPSYNNESWCRQNLESVLEQQYPAFRAIYVDDASTDDTPRLVEEHLTASAEGHRFTFLRNQTRIGAAANIDRVVRSCDPAEIVVLLDGDDLLAHRQVLQRLNAVYQDPNVWLTWGQFSCFPADSDGASAPIPSEVVSANAYRDYPFVSSHLRTFYAGLYQRIRPLDLQDCDGRFFTMAWDVALMSCLLEMAGPRARFVPEVLYKYNCANPINDDKVDRVAQLRMERQIRGKPRYGRLESLAGSKGPAQLYVGTGSGRRFFDDSEPLAEPCLSFRQLRSVLNRLGYTIRETQTLADIEDPHHIVVFDVRPEEQARLAEYPPEILSLVLWADPLSAPQNFDRRYHRAFGRVYTWCDDLVDDVRYFKLHLPVLRPMIGAVPYSASLFVRTFVDMVGRRTTRGSVLPRHTNRIGGVSDRADARPAGLT